MGVLHIFTVTFLAVLAITEGSRLGGTCRYDKDCDSVIEQTFCERQLVCACMEGYKPDENNDMCIANVGAICTSDSDCSSLQYSECRQGVCDCQRGYVPHPEQNECLPEASMYRAPCKEQIQCTARLSEGATCYQDKCVCLPQYHNYENVCLLNKGLNEACNSTGDCFLTEDMAHMVECVNNKCVCKSEYETVDNICRDEGVQVMVSLGSLLFCFLLALIIS